MPFTIIEKHHVIEAVNASTTTTVIEMRSAACTAGDLVTPWVTRVYRLGAGGNAGGDV